MRAWWAAFEAGRIRKVREGLGGVVSGACGPQPKPQCLAKRCEARRPFLDSKKPPCWALSPLWLVRHHCEDDLFTCDE